MTSAVFVDRLEGPHAVLLTEHDVSFTIPSALLPPDVEEGQWLRLTLTPDPERDRAARDTVATRRARLAEGDDGGDLAL